MQEVKTVVVNGREVPVLISDEKEALLAAKAAGRAIIGIWREGKEMDDISAARYVVEDPEDVTEAYLERVARRHLGLPWHICETERLLIREMFADDFDEVWANQIGHGFGTIEELEAYTKHQYAFYEFGFWALVEKTTGNLVGAAGLTVPRDTESEGILKWELDPKCNHEHNDETISGEVLELGYHIFADYRRLGYAKEACQAILRYGVEELHAAKFIVRIAEKNENSKHLAESLGFRA